MRERLGSELLTVRSKVNLVRSLDVHIASQYIPLSHANISGLPSIMFIGLTRTTRGIYSIPCTITMIRGPWCAPGIFCKLFEIKVINGHLARSSYLVCPSPRQRSCLTQCAQHCVENIEQESKCRDRQLSRDRVQTPSRVLAGLAKSRKTSLMEIMEWFFPTLHR
jgi:hypothetical protein